MNTSVHTPPRGTRRIQTEQHPPEQQVYRALAAVAQWVYDYLGVTGVKYGHFHDELIAVIKDEEPARFQPLGEYELSPGPIMFDGSRDSTQSYLDKVFTNLGLPRMKLPRNVAVWIYTGNVVEAHVIVAGPSFEKRCLYPVFIPRRRR